MPLPDWRLDEYVLSDQMGCYWSSLAATGDVNGRGCAGVPGLIEWAENTGPEGDYDIVLDSHLAMEEGLYRGSCDFWDQIGYN